MAEDYLVGRPDDLKGNLSVSYDAGPYIGIVKDFGDQSGMGRIAVFFPSLVGQRTSKEYNPKLKAEERENIILCHLALPYYGRTNATGKESDKKYANTTKSYGMWFPTPDIDTQVLVTFVQGRRELGYIIGYVPDHLMLHMVPGIPVSPVFYDTDRTKEAKLYSMKAGVKPPAQLPVAEYNKIDHKPDTLYKNIQRPTHPLTDTLLEQGLHLDYKRGLSTSGAQRETPSNVFGISTPGPLDRLGPKIWQGLLHPARKGMEAGTSYEYPASRKSGHTFIMDDGDTKGNSQLIRLRTSTGHQILLNDTDGIIYIGNSTGSAWIEMTNTGEMDVFSKNDIRVHSERNINFLADRDINIQSGENINIMAGHDLTLETNHHAVSGKGNLKFFVNGDMQMTSTGHMNFHTDKEFRQNAKEDISYTTLETIRVNSGGGSSKPIKMNTEDGTDADKATGLMWAGVPHDSEDKLNKAPWVTLDKTVTKTYKDNETYEYRTIMDRVPMHEPDTRLTEPNTDEPTASDTPHIVIKPTAASST